tara:strand:+ start:67 stop:543 length:477 start_codon:yes stop_codon:yes gene_type:complete
MNYHIEIEPMLMKTGYTALNQFDEKRGHWKRVHGLQKQFKRRGFENPKLVYTWIPDEVSGLENDSRTLAVEAIQHHLMGAKGLHAGDIKRHGTGWTEIFAVSRKQLLGYLGKAVQIASRLKWDTQAIYEWLKNYSQHHFGTDTWSEYLYGKKVMRTHF